MQSAKNLTLTSTFGVIWSTYEKSRNDTISVRVKSIEIESICNNNKCRAVEGQSHDRYRNRSSSVIQRGVEDAEDNNDRQWIIC